MADSLEQPRHNPAVSRPRVGAQLYRSADAWPEQTVPAVIERAFPGAGLYVASAYASVWDLLEISIPEDSRNEFGPGEMRRWLVIGAARINEHLTQRGWPVPLTAWSETVVWANTELAYVGLFRKRGGNTEGDWQNFRDREAQVLSWCQKARDREITPDTRLSDANIPNQAMGYVGDQARGWDQPRGYSGRLIGRKY